MIGRPTPERASCGCVPLFCDPCRAIGTSEDHDTLTFDVWLADFGRTCAEDALATHLDYAATWEKGVNPIDVRWSGGVFGSDSDAPERDRQRVVTRPRVGKPSCRRSAIRSST